MRDDQPKKDGFLAVSVAIRNIDAQSTDYALFPTVLQAVEYSIEILNGTTNLTAIVMVGEDESPASLEFKLGMWTAGLAAQVNQPGLFLTLAAQDIVRDRLGNDVRFEDFGTHGVADGNRAERLFAVIHPDLPQPILRRRRIAGNCPRLHKSFLGRHRELDDLQELIYCRNLITIKGPPGVGKTVMAIHVARSFCDEYEDGAWFFPVGDRTSMDGLLQQVASAKGLIDLNGPFSIERIAQALSSKRGILILDGCEAMSEGVGQFCAALRQEARDLTVIVTSTRRLRVENEFVYCLNPLSLPKPDGPKNEILDDEIWSRSEALNLFFERATQAGVRLPINDETIELVAGICRSIDGLPIAIELVAASLRSSSLTKIANDLRQNGNLTLRESSATGDFSSTAHALDVGWTALSEESKEALDRLSLFRGEWDLATATEVWAPLRAPSSTPDLHSELVDTSWLSYDPDRDTYRMLNTLRSFCEGRRAREGKSSDRKTAGRQSLRPSRISANLHLFCAGMASVGAKCWAGLHGADLPKNEILVDRHYADLIFALDTSIGNPLEFETTSKLVQTLVNIWLTTDMLEDADRLCKAFLATGISGIDALRARVMVGVVYLRRRQLAEAAMILTDCLWEARTGGFQTAEASILVNLGLTLCFAEQYEDARQKYAEVLPALRAQERRAQLCQALCNASLVELGQSSDPASRDARLAKASVYMAEAERLLPYVEPSQEESVWCLLGKLALARNELDAAEAYFYRSILVCHKHGLPHEAGDSAEALCEINARLGYGPTAAKLLGVSRRIRRETGVTRSDRVAQEFGRLLSAVCHLVDPVRAEKLMIHGEGLSLDQI